MPIANEIGAELAELKIKYADAVIGIKLTMNL